MVLVATYCLFLLLFHRRERVDMVRRWIFWIFGAWRVLTKKLERKGGILLIDSTEKVHFADEKGHFAD